MSATISAAPNAAPVAWSDEQLQAELRTETDPRERCLLLLCWDTGLALAKLQDVRLDSLLAQASGWGRNPEITIGGCDYRISPRAVAAIADWLIADRCPEVAEERRRDRETLEQDGWSVHVHDHDDYFIATSGGRTLGQAVELLSQFADGGSRCFSLKRTVKAEGGLA